MALKLDRTFFQKDAITLAQDLLGKILVRNLPAGIVSGKIVETEAYVGEEDLACHARFGKTKRNQIMYEKGGLVYIYLVYGIFYNFNITAAKVGQPEAVLIRALEPVRGKEIATKNLEEFGRGLKVDKMMSGPGKVCAAMKLDSSFYGEDLTVSDKLFLLDSEEKPEIEISKRIGIDYAGEYANKPWRFYAKGNHFVSK